MSEVNGFFLTQLFIRNSSLSGSAYIASVIIADKYDQRRGYASASSRTIAQQAGLSTKTVTAALNEIEESGEWTVVKSKGATTRYYPVIDKVTSRQDKKSKPRSERGVALAKSQSGAVSPAAADVSGNALKDVPVPEAEALYPHVDEDTDPQLNGLPILPSETGSIIDIVRPPVLSSPLAMAVRLHKRTDIKSRVNKKDFTVPKIEKLIMSLSQTGAPLEVIDILLWIQCDNRKPLSEPFLALTLSKCVNNGVVVKPVKWYEDRADPAYDLACEVFDVYQARHAEVFPEYAAYL